LIQTTALANNPPSDYNFERTSDGRCQIAPGLEALPADSVCTADPSRIEYWDVTGYRKIPLSTCQGGRELEFGGEAKPCPNHEEEFNRKYGVSGTTIFFAIVIPLCAAAAAGYWVYRKWDGKFGRIRLGDPSSEGSGIFNSDSPWVAWPVAAVSATVAVLAAVPLVVASVYRTVAARFGWGYGTRTYTSRSSFARGRSEYAAVDDIDDEGELLGEDSDEEA
jgi:hypothetical protein